MRTQLSRYSLGLMFCLASAVVVATGCTTSTGTSADTSGEQAAQTEAVAPPPAALSTKEIAEIMRLPRIDNQQLAEMFGGRLPAGAGASCSNLFQPCADNVDAVVTPCGGFQGVCGSTGTQQVVPLRFVCIPNNDGNGASCTAIQNGNQHAASCTVSSEGRSCSTGCNPDTCDYDKTCSVTGDQVRRCFSGGTCSNDQCVNQTFTDSVVGTCTRETEGLSCPRSELPPSVTCSAPKAPICSVSHVCACLLGPQ